MWTESVCVKSSQTIHTCRDFPGTIANMLVLVLCIGIGIGIVVLLTTVGEALQ